MACERISIKRHSIEKRRYRTGKYTVCRRLRSFFRREILQAGAVMGLTFPLPSTPLPPPSTALSPPIKRKRFLWTLSIIIPSIPCFLVHAPAAVNLDHQGCWSCIWNPLNPFSLTCLWDHAHAAGFLLRVFYFHCRQIRGRNLKLSVCNQIPP